MKHIISHWYLVITNSSTFIFCDVDGQGLQEKFCKTALVSRGQADTSLKIADLRSSKTTMRMWVMINNQNSEVEVNLT
jgi:hypothetical protein